MNKYQKKFVELIAAEHLKILQAKNLMTYSQKAIDSWNEYKKSKKAEEAKFISEKLIFDLLEKRLIGQCIQKNISIFQTMIPKSLRG